MLNEEEQTADWPAAGWREAASPEAGGSTEELGRAADVTYVEINRPPRALDLSS